MKRYKRFLWILAVILLLFTLAYLYSAFFRPMYGTNQLSLLFIGLALGGLLVFFALKAFSKSRPGNTNISESSHTVVESIKRVFKIVSAEGHFQEIYNYEETKKILKFIPSTKKALVVVRAKVLVGFDLEKFRWELNKNDKSVEIIEFPQPEILSIEPEYKYHYIEEDLFSFMKREDLHKIQEEAKKKIEEAVSKSDLKLTASEQMQLLLTEMVGANKWKISNLEKIKLLPELEVAAKNEKG